MVTKIIKVILVIFIVLSPLFTDQENNMHTKGNTSYWHLGLDTNNKWWFISPNNERTLLLSVQAVQPFQRAIRPPHFEAKNWPHQQLQQIKEFGFNSVGAWSHIDLEPHIPFAKDLNILKWEHDIKDIQWESKVESKIKELVTPYKDNKNLVGYYMDNEVWWYNYSNEEIIKYWETVPRLIKKHDPNHLILGVRFHIRPPYLLLIASRGKTDVHSYNRYEDGTQMWYNNLNQTHQICNTPIIISEFSYYSHENASGNGNMKAIGGRAHSQIERAQMFKDFSQGAISQPFIIGVDWFQWNDEPPTGRTADGEDCNYGIVDMNNNPYSYLVEEIKQFSAKMVEIHEGRPLSSFWKLDPEKNPH